AFTAVLFGIGKFLIGLYLGKASFGSTYGAAGSLVIVLVWVYYSAQIFFFGAEFTQVYAGEYGSDPSKTRQKKSEPARQAPATPAAPSYAEPVAQQSAGGVGGATAAAGSVLGSALAITKLVQLFRRSR
ncbi:MAG TPA: YhjD/YihY/BrkB family envelope integrity protein, partial [Bryobacteraceae bacterium]|nr:YhjD/YihY/BrkB family envelope integrity protein [Bryobacteraceae bacterium]